MTTEIATPRGLPTGLSDALGNEIHVGDILRKPVTANEDVHGDWALYRVKQQGIVPVLSYVRSEKGAILPEGILASPLSDEYDRKLFVFARAVRSIRPLAHIVVLSPEELRELQ